MFYCRVFMNSYLIIFWFIYFYSKSYVEFNSVIKNIFEWLLMCIIKIKIEFLIFFFFFLIFFAEQQALIFFYFSEIIYLQLFSKSKRIVDIPFELFRNGIIIFLLTVIRKDIQVFRTRMVLINCVYIRDFNFFLLGL